MNLQAIGVGVAIALFAWYFVGAFLNRQRAQQLIQAIRAATAAIGQKPAIRWYGRSAFQIDVSEPGPPLKAFRLLCILEPRDFALAWLWNRIRKRRDHLVFQADFQRAPRRAEKPDPHQYGIEGLDGVELRAETPHLKLTLQCRVGNEEAIARCAALVRELGSL